MDDYAQTYPQFMDQAIALGLGEADLKRLQTAYDLTERLCDGVYQAQSVPLSCHLVRSASILLALHQPVEVVAAGLIHGAYRLSIFRNSRRRRTNRHHRAMVRRELGEAIEQQLWVYQQLPWYTLEAVQHHQQQLDTYAPQVRAAVLIRLADYLDDYLDRAMAYAGQTCDDPKAKAFCEACQNLARQLGMMSLAQQIGNAFEANVTANLPQVTVTHRTRGYERPRKHPWEITPLESGLHNTARWVYRRLHRSSSPPCEIYGTSRKPDDECVQNDLSIQGDV